jgi:hypothetical protein
MAKRNVKATQKVFDFPFNGKNYKVNLKVEHYQDNGNIAIEAYHHGEPFATISVNIPGALSKKKGQDHIVLDTNNYQLDSFVPLFEKKVLIPAGSNVCSGFCTYPICKVDLTQLEETR